MSGSVYAQATIGRLTIRHQPSIIITDHAARGAGGYDWLAIWRAMVDAEHAQTAQIITPQNAVVADHWAGKAQSFARSTGRVAQPDAFMQAVLPQLRPNDTVLDIGAGAGRHTLFLAQQVAQVIAVEPSGAMRAQLAQRIAEQRRANVTLLADAWPKAAVDQCDIAICAHVLYGVREIGPFLQHMHTVTRRACFVLLGFQQPSLALSPFWERLYGTPRLPLPGALECLNVLHQLGIPAHMALLPASSYSFGTRQEALEDVRWRLALPNNPASDARIAAAIDELLVTGADDRLLPPAQPAHVALLWWKRA